MGARSVVYMMYSNHINKLSEEDHHWEHTLMKVQNNIKKDMTKIMKIC